MNTAAMEAISQARQARHKGNFAAARAHYAEAAALYRHANDSLSYAHAIRHIADVFMQESNGGEARPLYEEALALYRGNLATKILDLANTVRPYALLHEAEGNLHLAQELWNEAKQLYTSLRLEAGITECNVHLETLRRSAS